MLRASTVLAAAVGAAALAGCSSPTPNVGFPPANATSQPAAAKSRSYLYVANTAVVSAGGQRVEIFLQNDPGKGPVDSISSHVSEPDGILIDDSGALYVANADQSGDDKVTKYPQGATSLAELLRGLSALSPSL